MRHSRLHLVCRPFLLIQFPLAKPAGPGAAAGAVLPGGSGAQVCLSCGQCHDPAGALHILPGGTRRRGREQRCL